METTTLLFVMVVAGAIFRAGLCWLYLGGGTNSSWLHRQVGHSVTQQFAQHQYQPVSVPAPFKVRIKLYMELWEYILVKILSFLLICTGALVFTYMLLMHNSLLIAMPGLALFLAMAWLLERILRRR